MVKNGEKMQNKNFDPKMAKKMAQNGQNVDFWPTFSKISHIFQICFKYF